LFYVVKYTSLFALFARGVFRFETAFVEGGTEFYYCYSTILLEFCTITLLGALGT